jgi:hypothetical protein
MVKKVCVRDNVHLEKLVLDDIILIGSMQINFNATIDRATHSVLLMSTTEIEVP